MIHDDMCVLLGQVHEWYVLRTILVYVTGDSGYPNRGTAGILFSGSRLCRRFLSGVVGVAGVGVR